MHFRDEEDEIEPPTKIIDMSKAERDKETLWKAKWFKLFDSASFSQKHINQMSEAFKTILEIFKLEIKNDLEAIPGMKEDIESLEHRIDELERDQAKFKGAVYLIGFIITVIAAFGNWLK